MPAGEALASSMRGVQIINKGYNLVKKISEGEILLTSVIIVQLVENCKRKMKKIEKNFYA